MKLYNQRQGIRLHSHDVKYGDGSGQQVLLHQTHAALVVLKNNCARFQFFLKITVYASPKLGIHKTFYNSEESYEYFPGLHNLH